MKALILGGARSGKSGYAQSQAEQTGQSLLYLATGWAGDAEMQSRIRQHQSERGERWSTVEEPVHLARALEANSRARRILVVDCLTLWLSNCLAQNCWAQERQALLNSLGSLAGDVIFVSNEVGSGIVPLGPLNRQFADEAGRLHQALAARCDQVTLMVAGLPVRVKPS